MSIYFGASPADYGYKTSNIINHNGSYTWMAWAQLVSDTNSYGHIWTAMASTTDDWQNADWIGTGNDGISLRWGAANLGANSSTVSSSSFTVGVPVHIALVRSGNNLSGYFNGVSAGADVTQDITGRGTCLAEQYGTLNSLSCPVLLTAIKAFNAPLSVDEIVSEMQSIKPVRNLQYMYCWYLGIQDTIANALKNYASIGADLTQVGTLNINSATPPVSYGCTVIEILPVVVTAQYARPTSDSATGVWTASGGGSLYPMIDEVVADDGDYISTTAASICSVNLNTLTDPVSSSGHIVRYRISTDGGGIIVRLRQNTTVIASWTHNPGPSTLTTYSQTLTGGEADSITDYTALNYQFEAV